jgi:hypothetical protein
MFVNNIPEASTSQLLKAYVFGEEPPQIDELTKELEKRGVNISSMFDKIEKDLEAWDNNSV